MLKIMKRNNGEKTCSHCWMLKELTGTSFHTDMCRIGSIHEKTQKHNIVSFSIEEDYKSLDESVFSGKKIHSGTIIIIIFHSACLFKLKWIMKIR